MPENGRLRLYLSSLRLERWPRSLAIFPGVVAVLIVRPEWVPAGLIRLDLLLKVALAFGLTWTVSTANYIVNEITDAPYDAFHPGKRHRPLVQKEISWKMLMLLWLILVFLSSVLAFLFFRPDFLLALASLLIAGILYNVKPVRIKDIPYLDSTLESANNPIRFLIGWFVIEQTFPPITLLLCWWAFGNFLMVGKRVAEKKFLSPEESSGYRISLKKYTIPGLIRFMGLNGVLFLSMFSLFALRFRLKVLLFALPLIVVYLIIFMVKSVQDRDTAEEPEKLLRNPFFALYTLFLVVIFILAVLLR